MTELDFDKIFENYLRDWCKENADEYGSTEEMEDGGANLYDRWADSPCEALGGIAPRQFFERITDPGELVKLLIATGTTGCPCALLLDRIEQVPECSIHLAEIVRLSTNKMLIMLAINLLRDIDEQIPYDIYIKWLLDYGTEKCPAHIDGEIIELLVEVLAEKADIVGDLLLPFVHTSSYETKINLADILVFYPDNDIVYKLLKELFLEGNNIPLYAGYLGKYGDPRAIESLQDALGDCNYLEYMEVVGAIERLGGEVNIVRDFSEDPYYLALKKAR